LGCGDEFILRILVLFLQALDNEDDDEDDDERERTSR
jgi:hypothetical protein